MADPPFDITRVNEEVKSALVNATRAASQLASQDLSYERTLDASFGSSLDKQNAQTLRLAERLLASAAAETSLRPPRLRDDEDIEMNWRGIVETIDLLLEKTDICLDEYTGMIKRGEEVDEAKLDSPRPKKKQKPNPGILGKEFRTQNLLKPQILFRSKPDNLDNSPFKPLLDTKPHAIRSLDDSLISFTDEDASSQYTHPYELEIHTLQYPEHVFKTEPPIKHDPITSNKAVFVDTMEGVKSMLEELKTASEIAVDLEHHDTRSYVGLVSLMQISTRNKDWVVDTLKPWRRDLQILNEVFADPSILKVFHGAYMDMVWLQRDLGLYVVGLFDTYHACRRLGFPRASLSSLLEKYTDFEPDKKYQMADWRIRPLPLEMLHYARSDTHFLLYIYDNLRNELIIKSSNNPKIEDSPLMDVLVNSKETSLLRYEKFVYDAEKGSGSGGWYNTMIKSPGMFNKDQFAVFRSLHAWRDTLARSLDESVNFILPRQALHNLARIMPVDLGMLNSILHPISKPLEQRKSEVLKIIGAAKEASANDPEVSEFLASIRPERDFALSSFATSRQVDLTADHSKATNGHISVVMPVLNPELSLSIPTRITESRFWGTTLERLPLEVSSISLSEPSEQSEIRLALPLPPLTAEIFEEGQSAMQMSPSLTQETSSFDPGARAAIPFIKREPSTPSTPQLNGSSNNTKEQDDIIVLKKGSRRSGKGVVRSVDDVDMDDEEAQQRVHEKAARRAERKARRRNQKLAAADEASSDLVFADGDGSKLEASRVMAPSTVGATQALEPFDYASAASVLHPKKEKEARDGKKNRAAKGEGVFDPYKKSMDAPKGLGRRREVSGGARSMTFRK